MATSHGQGVRCLTVIEGSIDEYLEGIVKSTSRCPGGRIPVGNFPVGDRAARWVPLPLPRS
jgi:hypothetical protein